MKRALALVVLALPIAVTIGLTGGSHPASAATAGNGYWLVARDGGVFTFGDGTFHGSTGSIDLNEPIVGMAAHPSGNGYWFVAADGGVFAFGSAKFFGSMGGQDLNEPIVGMAAHPSGNGYWLVARDGGIFSFGDSKFQGSTGSIDLNEPIVGMTAHPSGNGYWFVASDGGIFSFGDSKFFGSMGGQDLNEPIVGMAAHPGSGGYWLVASDGGIFGFGSAKFFGSTGSIDLNEPIVGMTAHPSGNGYWFVASDGGIFSFGDSKFFGSMGGQDLNEPIVGMAVTPEATRPSVTVNQASGQEDPTDESAVDFTVTFSEPVTGFTGSDVAIGGTAGATTATVTGSGTTYNVAVSGMTNDGTVTVSVPEGKAVDAAGNSNTSSTSTDNSVAYENTDPSVTVNQAAAQTDPTDDSPINFTVVFSKPVTGFTDGDVDVAGTAGGTKTVAVTGSGTTYNVAISGMTSNGTVIPTVDAGKAFDAIGNPNTDSTSTDNTVTYDNGDPTPTVSTADGQENPTDETTIDFKVVFSEDVTGFETGDVTPGGTATGSKTAVITGSGSTYNVAVSGVTGDGTVIVQVPENKAIDAAGNPNVLSNEHTINVDRSGPTMTVTKAATQENPTDEATIDFTVTFNEVVTGFTEDDVALDAGGTGANDIVVTGDAEQKVYNVAVSGMTQEGTVKVTVPAGAATDSAGNSSTGPSDASVVYDTTGPTPTLAKAASQPSPTNEPVIDFTVEFGDDVTDFDDASDVTLAGAPGATATIGDAGDADASTYSVAVTGATGTGTLTVTIPIGAAKDGAGNSTNASNPASVDYDYQNPTFDSVAATGGSNTVTATFSEPVLCNTVQPEDFAVSGAEVTGVTCTGETDGAIELALDTAPDGGTTVHVTYAANPTAITDRAGNSVPSPTTRSTTAVTSFTVKVTKPATQPDPTNETTINFTVTFSEPVAANSFQSNDVVVGGSATYGTQQVVPTATNPPGDNTVFDVAVSGMTTNTTGTVTISIPAGRVQDADGNLNAASQPEGDAVVDYDSVRPTVTDVRAAETQDSPTSEPTVDFTVVFSHPVTGFGTEDLLIGETGTADAEDKTGAAITTTDNQTYNVAIDATGDGTVTLRVAAGANDSAGNTNQESATTPASVTLDNTDPRVEILAADGQSDPTNDSSIEFEVTFTEPVFGLNEGDFTLGGSAAPTTKQLAATSSPLVYIVTVTGMVQDGEVTLSLPASRATDDADNPNEASTGDSTVNYETVRPIPGITRTGPANTSAGTVTFTVTFSEAMTGFDENDVTVTGPGTPAYDVSNTQGTTYTVTVQTPTDGAYTVEVEAGGATDSAGNTNTGPVSASVTRDSSRPTVTVSQHAEQTENPTNEAQIEFAVVFNEPVTGFDNTDVVAAGAGATQPAAVDVTGSGTTYKVVVSGMTADEGTVTLSVKDNAAQDAANNLSQASTTPGSVEYDKLAPVFEAVVANAGSTKVLADFDELLDCTSVTSADFKADIDGVPAIVTGVACAAPSDEVIELTLTSAPAAGQTVTVTLRTTAGGVADRAGNVTTTQQQQSTAAQPLTTTVARVGLPYTNANSVQFTVTFSEDVTGFTAADVTVAASGPFTKTVEPGAGPEDVYTVTIAGMTDGDITVSVPAGAANDTDGTPNAASNTATATRDTDPPAFTGVSATAADEDLLITFDEPVNCNTVAAGDFTVEFNAVVPATEASVTCAVNTALSTFTLTLGTPVPAGATVEVDLAANAIADRAGNLAPAASRSDTAGLA